MNQSDLLDLSVNSEHHFVLLERKENKAKIVALLQSIASLGLGEDPIQQLVQVAQLGMLHLRKASEMSRLSSYPESRIEMRSVDSDRSFSRTDLQKCEHCGKHFQSVEILEQHIVKRHTEPAGARTERKPPSRKDSFEPVHRTFAAKYAALEKSVFTLNGQKTKVQDRLNRLDPSSSEACTALRTAVKLQQELNNLLEKQKSLLDAQAVQVHALQFHLRNSDLSSCTMPASVPSHTASLASLAEPPRPPRYLNQSFWQRKRRLSRESLDSGPVLAPSSSTSQLNPHVPKEPMTGPKTSRRGLYRPSTRYRPLELSYSDIHEESLQQVKEKAAELKAMKGKYEVLVGKYGLELCACYQHRQEDIEIMRGNIEKTVEEMVNLGDIEELKGMISDRKSHFDYSLTRDRIQKQAQLLVSYQSSSPNLPLKLLPKAQPRIPLYFSYNTDDSLHANSIPEPFPQQKPTFIEKIPTSNMVFCEGKLESRVSTVRIVPISGLEVPILRQLRGIRESLITLDLNDSVSFSIVWGDEEDEEEWRVLGLEEAQRLGFFP